LGCPFSCIYCNQFAITKADAIDWDDTLFNVARFIAKNAVNEKEVAFFGGSFTCLTKTEMTSYFAKILPLFDDKTYFRVSTRPDAINEEVLAFLKENRVRTIELGVQSFSDVELTACRRGYSADVAVNACQSVLQSGFSLCVQLLLGLPQADMVSYQHTLGQLLRVKPHFVRLYPLVVLKGTELEAMYARGEYKPLDMEGAVNVCKWFYDACVSAGIKVIKIGLHSDIAGGEVVAGPYGNIGEIVRH